jgi:uncharacterized membrane protein
MSQYRILSGDGQEFGPVDLATVEQWIRQGRIIHSTRIRKDDEAAVAAEFIPEISALLQSTRATAPPIPPIAMNVPVATEFRVWGFIGQAWELVKPHWVPLGLMVLLSSIAGVIPVVGPIIVFLLQATIMVGINRAILGMMAGRAPTVGMMFEGFDRFGQAFLAQLVTMILVSIGLVLCIVPGIILSIMWMFTSLRLAETNEDFWTAMQSSANLTRGYRWELFFLMLACIPVILLGLLAFCIGVVVAQAVCMTAVAVAYRFLQARQAQAAGGVVA